MNGQTDVPVCDGSLPEAGSCRSPPLREIRSWEFGAEDPYLADDEAAAAAVVVVVMAVAAAVVVAAVAAMASM